MSARCADTRRIRHSWPAQERKPSQHLDIGKDIHNARSEDGVEIASQEDPWLESAQAQVSTFSLENLFSGFRRSNFQLAHGVHEFHPWNTLVKRSACWSAYSAYCSSRPKSLTVSHLIVCGSDSEILSFGE